MSPLQVATLMVCVLAVGAADLAWQDPQPSVQPNLKALRQAARDRIAADFAYDSAKTPTARQAAAVVRVAARDNFQTAFDEFERKAGRSLLLDAKALAAVFENAIVPAKAPPTLGAVTVREEDDVKSAVFVPADYDPSRPHPMVCLLAGRKQQGDPKAVQTYLEQTWGQAARRERILLVAPVLPSDLDLDGLDPKGPTGPNAELARIRAAMQPLGQSWQSLHLSRDRMVLDCGRGTSAFGLRLVSLFPDRFSGVVLRWPTVGDKLRVKALHGIPVLLVRCPETAAACDKLRKLLHTQDSGSCQILTPPGPYPFADDTGIAEWSLQQRRVAMAKQVVLAPIHDRFHRNRWVQIRKADPVGSAPWLDAPVIEATADPVGNRITVTTRGVQEFTLMVGPALVDVRDFLLVVNGKETRVRLQPSLNLLLSNLTNRNDSGHLVTAQHRVVVQ